MNNLARLKLNQARSLKNSPYRQAARCKQCSDPDYYDVVRDCGWVPDRFKHFLMSERQPATSTLDFSYEPACDA
jgi:hypothetical protein